MKNFKILLVAALSMTALMTGACAKKDSEFAARYAKNKLGANVVDGAKTQAAGENAATQGLEADIVDIKQYVVANDTSGVKAITAKILINNQEMPVTTRHSGTEMVEGRVDVNGFTIVFHSMCGSVDCSLYYAAMEIYKDNKMVIQEGVRKYFDDRAAELDVYQWLTPENALPLLGSDSQDIRGMIGFLNSYKATSSGIVK